MRHTIALTATAAAMLIVNACGSASTGEDAPMPDDTESDATDPVEAGASEETRPTTDPAVSETSEPDAASTTRPITTDAVTTEPVATEQETTEPTSSEAPDAEAPASTIDRLGLLAATDLSQRLGVDIESVDIVDVEEVTWSDASLGCPQKDFQYAQVLTPGVRILLNAQDISYTYHAGSDRDPFYCVDPQQPV